MHSKRYHQNKNYILEGSEAKDTRGTFNLINRK